jgi:serine/threonine protein kinase
VLEYCDAGDFESYLRAQPHGRLKEDEAKQFLVQLVRGLHYLRSLDVIHRDLKPENLLLQRSADNSVQLKIGDFGLARAVSNPFELAQTQCGSQLYMSPEIWLGEQYTYKTDLWSFGVILFRTLTGRPLFKTTPSLKQLKSTLPHEQLFQAQQWPQLSALAADLLTRLLVHDPTRRITWEEFMLHPYWAEWLEHDTPLYQGSQCSNTSLSEDVLLNDHPLTRVTQPRDSASHRSSNDSSDLNDFHVVKQHSDDVYSREARAH